MQGDTTTLGETEVDLWSEFMAVVASHLKNSTHYNALLAYDVMNEPDYHVKPLPNKQRACEIISTWYDAIKNADPCCLVTIGNCGMDDLFSFDPSTLKVDFNSLHYYPGYNTRPYENRTLPSVQQKIRIRTASDLYWFNQASIVPWIVGETGFTASAFWGVDKGLNGTLADMGNFVTYSLNATCNCGGSGYSWWQYKDVRWYNDTTTSKFGNNFYGLLARTEVGQIPDPFVEKPIVNLFRNYTPGVTGPCPVDKSDIFDENKIYYNRFGYTAPNNLKIERTVKDLDGNPIKDAVVLVSTYFGKDTIKKYILNGVERDTLYSEDRYDVYYTHTDINGKFIAIPCPTRYGFVGHGTIPDTPPYIYGIWVSAAGAEKKEYYHWDWETMPNLIELKKIKDDVVISGETVLSGQYKAYKGRKSLTVYNTNVNTGGWADFTSQKSILFLPGFTANAGSNVNIYIAPPDCNELSSFYIPRGSDNYLLKNKQETKDIKLLFEKDFTETSISVFPNPTNSTATIQLHSTNKEAALDYIKLYDIFGRTILSVSASGISHVINVSTCPQGIYFIEAKTLDKTYYQKLIIQ